jgi:adenine nucleotide transporter 17
MSQNISVKDELQKSTATAPPDAVSQQSDNVAHALAGSGGGLISMALTYPLITLSTRAQVESKKADTNVLQAARKIIAREGVRGLYAGLESALFGISVTNFVYYYWYEWTRAAFIKAAKASNRPNASKLSTLETMLAGALAGSATVLMTNPIWVVNTRMTARKNESDESALPTVEGDKPKRQLNPSTIGTLLAIIKDEGFMRLFAGVLPALVLVINPILQYTIFEQLKQRLEKRRRVTPKDSFYLGALGKLAATSITYPYITVKSRAHVASGKKEGIFESFSRILREEGWAGLYGGKSIFISVSSHKANILFRYRSQGHSECHHCSFLVRIQGRSVQCNSQGSQNHCSEGIESCCPSTKSKMSQTHGSNISMQE